MRLLSSWADVIAYMGVSVLYLLRV